MKNDLPSPLDTVFEHADELPQKKASVLRTKHKAKVLKDRAIDEAPKRDVSAFLTHSVNGGRLMGVGNPGPGPRKSHRKTAIDHFADLNFDPVLEIVNQIYALKRQVAMINDDLNAIKHHKSKDAINMRLALMKTQFMFRKAVEKFSKDLASFAYPRIKPLDDQTTRKGSWKDLMEDEADDEPEQGGTQAVPMGEDGPLRQPDGESEDDGSIEIIEDDEA